MNNIISVTILALRVPHLATTLTAWAPINRCQRHIAPRSQAGHL
jgi:hypothetical protein